MVGLKTTDTCWENFVRLRLLTLYSLYVVEVILFVKKKDAAITNRQVNNHLTRNSLDYYLLPPNLQIYNSRPVFAGFKLYNKLPAHIKGISDGWLFKKKLKELLIKGCYYSTDEFMNDDFCHTGIWDFLLKSGHSAVTHYRDWSPY
jgi:hypothetical protein